MHDTKYRLEPVPNVVAAGPAKLVVRRAGYNISPGAALAFLNSKSARNDLGRPKSQCPPIWRKAYPILGLIFAKKQGKALVDPLTFVSPQATPQFLDDARSLGYRLA